MKTIRKARSPPRRAVAHHDGLAASALAAAFSPAAQALEPASDASRDPPPSRRPTCTVMHTIYQVDGQGKDSYEVANGSVATYWWPRLRTERHALLHRLHLGHRERYGKPGEDDAGPDTRSTWPKPPHADRLHARQALAVSRHDQHHRQFRRLRKARVRRPQAQARRIPHAAGQLVLALPTDGFDNGTSFTGYALFVFNPGPRDELKDKVWTYVGSVNTGSDNSAACADGDVMPCVSSQGELSFAAHGGSDMPASASRSAAPLSPGRARPASSARPTPSPTTTTRPARSTPASSGIAGAVVQYRAGRHARRDAHHPGCPSRCCIHPVKRRATVGRPSCCGAEHEPPDPGFRPVAYCLAGHALPDRHHGTVPVGRPALLSNTRQLCDAARHAGVAVYFAKIHFSPGYPEVSP